MTGNREGGDGTGRSGRGTGDAKRRQWTPMLWLAPVRLIFHLPAYGYLGLYVTMIMNNPVPWLESLLPADTPGSAPWTRAFVEMAFWRVFFLFLAAGGATLLLIRRQLNRSGETRLAAGLRRPTSGGWRRAALYYAPYLLLSALAWCAAVHIGAGTPYLRCFEDILRLIFGEGLFTSRVLYTALGAALLPALMEEAIFCGIGLADVPAGEPGTLPLVRSSLIYAVFRFNLAFAVFGGVMGLIRLRTSSLYCAVLIHLIHKSLLLAGLYWWFTRLES